MRKNDDIINLYAEDILKSESFISQKEYMQHGKTSVYEHILNVANMSVTIAYKYNLKVDMKSLIRGSLLHDYFLYDWHENDKSHRLHGFHHARKAMMNAKRDFGINNIEENMIIAHMFPLNLRLPKYKESVILCCSDKICAIIETFKRK